MEIKSYAHAICDDIWLIFMSKLSGGFDRKCLALLSVGNKQSIKYRDRYQRKHWTSRRGIYSICIWSNGRKNTTPKRIWQKAMLGFVLECLFIRVRYHKYQSINRKKLSSILTKKYDMQRNLKSGLLDSKYSRPRLQV